MPRFSAAGSKQVLVLVIQFHAFEKFPTAFAANWRIELRWLSSSSICDI